MAVSIIIPTLNEKETIGAVLFEIKAVSSKIDLKEIVVVDSSTDGTDEIAKREGAYVLKIPPCGKGYAIRAGLRKARGNPIVVMDADFSHSAFEIPLMLKKLKEYEVVCASRLMAGGGSSDMTPLRRLGNKLVSRLINGIWQTKYTDVCYGFRAFRKNIARDLALSSNGFEIETELSIKIKKRGIRSIEVPSFERKRSSGTGKLLLLKDGLRILRQVVIECIWQGK